MPDPDRRAEHSTQLLHGEELHRLRDARGRPRLGPGRARRLRRLRRGRRGSARRRAAAAGSPRSGRTSMPRQTLRSRGAGRAAVPRRGRRSPAAPAASSGCAAAATSPRPHLAPVAGDVVAQAERFLGVPYLWGGRSAAASTVRAWCSWRSSPAGARRRAIPTCRRRCSARRCPEDAALATRRPGLLAGPRRDHAGPRDAAPRQRPPHGGGVEPLAVAATRIAAAGGGPIVARRRP